MQISFQTPREKSLSIALIKKYSRHIFPPKVFEVIAQLIHVEIQ